MSAPAATAPKNVNSSTVGEYKVQVYLYDLSQGMASAMSMGFLGKQIDGIWHTGLVVYGQEYFFGGGICCAKPGMTQAGKPVKVIDMGYTRIPPQTFHEFLQQVSHRFTQATYSLLNWNCNNFTNESSLFLLGQPIPAYITGLPQEALSTPFGQMLLPMITQMEQQMKNNVGTGQSAGGIPWSTSGGALYLPNLAGVKPDRMVDPDSNPTVPHSALQSAAALASAAIQQAAPSNVPASSAASTAVAAAGASSSFSSSSTVSVLNRSTPSKLLTSSDKKAKSFHILVKTNAKKVVATGLTPEQDATLTALVNALAEESSSSKITVDGARLLETFFYTWSLTLQFPVLGLMRLVVLREEVRDHVVENAEKLVKRLLEFLKSVLDVRERERDCVCKWSRQSHPFPASVLLHSSSTSASPANAQAMSLCTLSNLLTLPSLGVKYSSNTDVWTAIRSTSVSENLTVRLMSATVCFNAVVLLCQHTSQEDDVLIEALTHLEETSKKELTAQEVQTRLLFTIAEICLVQNTQDKHAALIELLVGLEYQEALTEIGKKFTAEQQIQSLVKELSETLRKAQQSSFQVQ